MKERVAVIGMGYVGLPLAIAMTNAGKKVLGIDTDSSRISELTHGQSFTGDVTKVELKDAVRRGLRFSDDYGRIRSCEVVVIAVPTPLKLERQEPDLDSVLNASRMVASRLKRGSLVVIESTVAPGTTEGRILSEFSAAGKILDHDFFLGFSPERVNPGSEGVNVAQIPKLTSGVSEESAKRCDAFYSSFVETTILVKGTREAEFAKLLENSYRLVNIAFVNELALAAWEMGIDFEEVIEAAATKPYGYQAFYPSAGAGGHCIPVDPVYLNSQIALDTGSSSSFLDLALRMNEGMVEEIVKVAEKLVPEFPGRRILVAGISYKPGVSDVRNSPGSRLIEKLMDKGADVHFFDPLVEEILIGDKRLNSISLAPLPQGFDVVVVLHSISSEQLEAFRRTGSAILDLWKKIETS